MNHEHHNATPKPANSMADALHGVVRFARVLRYRISYVAVALGVSCLLGGLYYTTSTRLYEARASLLVIPTGADLWNATTSVDGSRQALLPTYVHLFQEDVVLDRAAEYLAIESAVESEFRDVPPDKWACVIRQNLSAERERRTNLILLAYRARSPRAAEAVVAAVNRAYLDFIDKNHRDVSGELVRMLEIERRYRETTERQAAGTAASQTAVRRSRVERVRRKPACTR